MPTLEDLRDTRLAKAAKLRELGIDPYPASAQKDISNGEVKEQFDSYNGKTCTLTGRLMSMREHGNLIFGDLRDQSGSIQLFIKKDTIKPTSKEDQCIGFDDMNLIDVGDFLQATGEITKTTSGEISLLVHSLKLLTKSLRPLPDKHEGLKDPETIFRRRYLDLVMNPERKEVFKRKAKFWEVNRSFLKEHGFMEVETPVLEHVTGGADARPFVTHMNALDQDFYMRISTELYQKRLIGGGYEKVYTIGPNFRNEGISDEHLPEYHQVEWYWAYADYRQNMNLVRDMIRTIAQEVYGRSVFTRGEHTFDVSQDWEEIDYARAIKERLGVDIFTDSDEKMSAVLKAKGIILEGTVNRSRLIDNVWKVVRKTIAGPAFLINEPKFMSPLSKSIPENPALTQRFHVILAGSELGNGYSELNDPVDQFDRFMDQQKARNEGDDEAQMLDIDFVEMLEYGMPPTSGYGHSERLFWFLEGVTAREGTLFPHLRYTISDQTRAIYGLSQKTVQSIAPTKQHEKESLPQNFGVKDAVDMLETYVQNQNLRRHCMAVGYVMRALADHFGGNPDVWEILGLLHDSDWEITKDTPEQHTKKTLEWLEKKGLTEGPIVRAIKSHNRAYTQLAEIEGIMEWSLETCDELTGFIVAVALTRPTKLLSDVTVDSVLKKWKSKEFAKAVDRKHIMQCEKELGISLPDFIQIALTSMQEKHDILGL